MIDDRTLLNLLAWSFQVTIVALAGAREEVVDQLTVLQTNARRNCLRALLMFADEPAPAPASLFRMQLISKEGAISSRRVVLFCAAVLSVVVTAGVTERDASADGVGNVARPCRPAASAGAAARFEARRHTAAV